MELIFAFLAGLLTLINPCVLPVLPIVLASSTNSHRLGPIALAAGLTVSFVTLGMLISTVGFSIGLSEGIFVRIGAVMMIGFGLILLLPPLNKLFSKLVDKLSINADAQIDQISSTGLRSQFLGGMLLGAVWSPCIGPTLGGAISLASQGTDLFWAFLIMTSFGLGVSCIIIALGFGTAEAIRKRQKKLGKIGQNAQKIMGITFVAVGLLILFGIHYYLEIWLLNILPIWVQDLSVQF